MKHTPVTLEADAYDPERLYTVKEAMQFLSVSRGKLWDLEKNYGLVATRIPGGSTAPSLRFRRRDLMDFTRRLQSTHEQTS